MYTHLSYKNVHQIIVCNPKSCQPSEFPTIGYKSMYIMEQYVAPKNAVP